MEDKFTTIYNKSLWGKVDGKGTSGTGSKMSPDNLWYVNELKNIIKEKSITTICDIGCGDWNICKEMDWTDLTYVGLDVYKDIIGKKTELYGTDNISFRHADILKETIKGYDLIIIKDVLQHWEDCDVIDVLNELVNKNKYVYVINGYKFGRSPEKNGWTIRDINNKYSYHPLDMYKYPLNQFHNHTENVIHRRYKQYVLLKCQGSQGKNV